jgi:uncharacterized protein (DUF433 family)
MVDWKKRIEVNPKVMFGKPVIAGTRLPVDIILRKLAAQMTVEQIIGEYPVLTPEDIFAVLAYASDTIGAEPKVASGGAR